MHAALSEVQKAEGREKIDWQRRPGIRTCRSCCPCDILNSSTQTMCVFFLILDAIMDKVRPPIPS